jgi:PAS domain S-box-containing protein
MCATDSHLQDTVRQLTLELRASEARFRNIVSISTDAIVILDSFGVILFVNPAAAGLFGRAAEKLLGEHFGFPVIASETTEVDIANREGKQTVAEMRVVATEWEGNPAFLATLRDITERRNAELYRAMMQSPSNLNLIVTDPNGTIEYVNPKLTETTGYSAAELIGKSPRILKSESTPSEVYQGMWETITAGREWHGELINRKKNGQLYQDAVSIVPVTDAKGDITHFFAVTEDITGRKMLAAETQDAREYAENIVETVREPLVVLNSELKILTANLSFYETFKVTPEETIGHFIYDLGNRQWDIPKLRVLFEDILPHDTVISGYEVEHDFLDIGLKTILLNARQIFRKDIGSHIILLAMEDITERKRAGEEIRRLNVSLGERANELEAANQELETFNYTVAHDLRQPLNVMSMYCQSIKLLCGDQLQEECQGYVQDAYSATLRMDRLIGALLDFSRMGRVQPHRESVDLSMLVHEVARSLQLTEPARQVQFRVADGIVAHGDAGLLQVVLDNLLGNAWKYSGMREQVVIEFGVRVKCGMTAYFVQDNGAGFAMADAAKLFTPFQRLPGSEKSKGFGIGLATVERIIRKHGGRVWAESEPGTGATFYFTLAEPYPCLPLETAAPKRQLR